MKLNKKKWFEKNVLEFVAFINYKDKSETIMSYDKYGQIGGYVSYHFIIDSKPTTKATSRKLFKMKLWKAYFYLRHLSLHKYEKMKVRLIDTKMSDAL